MLRFLAWTAILATLAAPLALVVAAVEPEPAVKAAPPLTPATSLASQNLLKQIHVAATGDEPAAVTMTEGEIDGLFATAARAAPGLRGRARIDDEALHVTASLGPPTMRGLGWLNLTAEVARSDAGLILSRLRIGRLELPPQTTLSLLQRLADLATGEPVGSLLTAMVQRIETAPGRVTATLNPAGKLDGEIQVAEALHGLAGARDMDRVGAHYIAMDEAARQGELPRRGSAGLWIGFALQSALDAVAEGRDPVAETRAAILALAALCGGRDIIELTMGPIPAPFKWRPCEKMRLAGRHDLRQHFVLSAAFETTASAAVSFGMGEVKELVDAAGDGTGFSFDDMAADLAGIRWAQAARAAAAQGPEALARLARLSTDETAVMPSVAGLPSLMQKEVFRDRFGEVDSPAYLAQIEAIDQRIDRLPIHAR